MQNGLVCAATALVIALGAAALVNRLCPDRGLPAGAECERSLARSVARIRIADDVIGGRQSLLGAAAAFQSLNAPAGRAPNPRRPR
jgi:hypothetical protein